MYVAHYGREKFSATAMGFESTNERGAFVSAGDCDDLS